MVLQGTLPKRLYGHVSIYQALLLNQSPKRTELMGYHYSHFMPIWVYSCCVCFLVDVPLDSKPYSLDPSPYVKNTAQVPRQWTNLTTTANRGAHGLNPKL